MTIDRRHFMLALASLGATTLVAGRVHADRVDDALLRVSKARASIKTLQAPFKQKRIIGLLASEVESNGLFTLVHPNRLRWDLKPPDAVSYFIGPKGLAVASKDGVTKIGKSAAGRFAAVLGDLMVMLGGDMRKLRKRYHLTVDETGGRFRLTAKPKSKDVAKHVAKLTMESGKKLWVVERIEIHEKNGDQSIIEFGKFTRDKAIDPKFMKAR